ncbi:hypothetical protein GCM10027037_05670 [Mucilaginibacter koreensis]
MNKGRLILYAAIFMLPVMLIFSQCFTDLPSKDPRGILYAGSKTCIQCHKDIYSNYLHTAHFQSVQLASSKSVSGSFEAGNNSVLYNDGFEVVMQKCKSGFYQAAYRDGKRLHTERIDLVFGGVKAETYLYWKGNELYELPVSYFKRLHQWTNSPGYAAGQPNYSRMIVKRCFECHSSFVSEASTQTYTMHSSTKYNKSSLILNIDCERCHGPAANHVNYHNAYPGLKNGMYIARYSKLTRAQKVDMCAVCHSGNKGAMYKSTFYFKPGDTLATYQEPDFVQQHTNPATLDVHGNQTQMLAASACFIKSSMDCATCHNTHQQERDNLAMYSKRCMQCHSTTDHKFCKMLPKLGSAILNNCIDCHMPAKPSDAIRVQTGNKALVAPYMVRSHRIAIYPDITKLKSYVKSISHS